MIQRSAARSRLFLAAISLLTASIAMWQVERAHTLDFPLFSSSDLLELPLVLSETNTTIAYELDAAIHKVHGQVSKLGGRVYRDAKDPSRINVELSFSPSEMNSGNESRDSRMRSLLNVLDFPSIEFRSSAPGFDIKKPLPASGQTSALFEGQLTIRGVSRLVRLPIDFEVRPSMVIGRGELSILLGDFGIPDPSTLLARVSDSVVIRYKVSLSR